MNRNDKLAQFESLVPEVGVSRRDFVVTALGAGFALAVQPVLAQQAIHTDSKGLVAGEVQVAVADGMMAAYSARPAAGGKRPVVLVVQEIFGVHEHIRDICRRLAKLGYLAVAPELYARQGDPQKIAGIAQILTDIVSKVPDAQVMADLDACVKWAAKNGGDPTRLGITGFCWGGRVVWMYGAHNPRVKAAVAWYGRLVGDANGLTPSHPLDIAATLRVPVLGLYGGADGGIPLESVAKMQAALAAGSSGSRLVVYKSAGHAFNADYRASYLKEAADDGWQQMQTWFRQHGL